MPRGARCSGGQDAQGGKMPRGARCPGGQDAQGGKMPRGGKMQPPVCSRTQSQRHPFQVEVDAAGPAIKKLGGKLLALELVDSFSADGQRTAVVVSKVQIRSQPTSSLILVDMMI